MQEEFVSRIAFRLAAPNIRLQVRAPHNLTTVLPWAAGKPSHWRQAIAREPPPPHPPPPFTPTANAHAAPRSRGLRVSAARSGVNAPAPASRAVAGVQAATPGAAGHRSCADALAANSAVGFFPVASGAAGVLAATPRRSSYCRRLRCCPLVHWGCAWIAADMSSPILGCGRGAPSSSADRRTVTRGMSSATVQHECKR